MKEELERRLYMVEYKDQSDYGCGEEVKAIDENHAVRVVQMELLNNDDFMSKLIDVYEVEDECSCNDCNPEWKLDDGTVLDEESQDILNDAFSTYTNSNGLTLEEAMERASQNRNK